ncbi:hypothetical protein EOJ36_08365 [Sandaracinomonas limnophila]|uniref:Uncharacterized protein n=2 Tax=Sandaracinomonas limnophila TaxID=1862386 RepID=A0A437PRW9_9BACT|nr:hypothetical protein EOJ36_08365 [Sandaracinomonas limnophila]
MGRLLQETMGKLADQNKQNQKLLVDLETKENQIKDLSEKIKDLEKNNKISEKIAKIVVNTENTVVPTTDLKKKLEQYISIIEHSIEALKNK